MEKETSIEMMSESEKETRRKEIIQRLLELAHTVEGGSTENEMRWQEAKQLEKELLEIDPIRTNFEPIPEIKIERRVRKEDREAIKRLLEDKNNP